MAKTSNRGRPRVAIDWETFDKLCAIQCTLSEIASFFNCAHDAIQRAVIREHKTNFASYYEQKSEKGRISIRRRQFQSAETGNVTMLIWLGKQWLGQRDKANHEISGPDGKPIETKADVTMTDERRDARILELAAKLPTHALAGLLEKKGPL
jgi:hypothetical protein